LIRLYPTEDTPLLSKQWIEWFQIGAILGKPSLVEFRQQDFEEIYNKNDSLKLLCNTNTNPINSIIIKGDQVSVLMQVDTLVNSRYFASWNPQYDAHYDDAGIELIRFPAGASCEAGLQVFSSRIYHQRDAHRPMAFVACKDEGIYQFEGEVGDDEFQLAYAYLRGLAQIQIGQLSPDKFEIAMNDLLMREDSIKLPIKRNYLTGAVSVTDKVSGRRLTTAEEILQYLINQI